MSDWNRQVTDGEVSLYSIESPEISENFARCWSAAGKHLAAQTGDANINWLRCTLKGPALEHISFRLGNQLFFIRLIDVDSELQTPGNDEGFLRLADGCHGHPCFMPMQEIHGQWQAARKGWGLVHAKTGEAINPFDLVSDKKIEMTDWELLSFAIQVVCSKLEDKPDVQSFGYLVDPMVNPSVWVSKTDGSVEWLIVRGIRYPSKTTDLPENIEAVRDTPPCMGKAGTFIGVSVRNAEQDINNPEPIPLWRGHGLRAEFSQIEEL